MIDKEDLLNNKDFYKSFKNGEDLTSFFKELHKRAVEHMLDAELDSHLDNENTKKPPMETTVTDTKLRRLSHPLANPKLKFLVIEKGVLNLL